MGFQAQTDGSYLLTGKMSFDGAAELLPQGGKLLGTDAVFDLAGVSYVDSAGLALLIEWIRLATNNGTTLRFRNVPDALMAIARLSDLAESLPLEVN